MSHAGDTSFNGGSIPSQVGSEPSDRFGAERTR
jgi:hypothetical protein